MANSAESERGERVERSSVNDDDEESSSSAGAALTTRLLLELLFRRWEREATLEETGGTCSGRRGG